MEFRASGLLTNSPLRSSRTLRSSPRRGDVRDGPTIGVFLASEAKQLGPVRWTTDRESLHADGGAN